MTITIQSLASAAWRHARPAAIHEHGAWRAVLLGPGGVLRAPGAHPTWAAAHCAAVALAASAAALAAY